jgi:hypothetical protein
MTLDFFWVNGYWIQHNKDAEQDQNCRGALTTKKGGFSPQAGIVLFLT